MQQAKSKASPLKRFAPLIVCVLLAIAGYLLYRALGQYDFAEVAQSVRDMPAWRLGLAALFAAGSYVALTGFDTLAVRYLGKDLAYPKIALASFTSLSIGHTLGMAAVSSGALRYRFYSRWGFSTEDVAKLVLFCGMTVGLGLITLGGVALLINPKLAAELTRLSQPLVIALGLGCLALPALYLLAAVRVTGTLTLWRWSFEMPDWKIAALQLVVGPVNFALVAASLHQALLAIADVPYVTAATGYVIANFGALVSHVPGGLGVIESILIFLLPSANILGALLVFRFVYYLAPLMLGGLTLALSELVLRRQAQPAAAGD
ncbi:lysylphosphatidylglycerol synthase domain-containing protein [Oceanibaculum pacificum]|uniref:lysylphosphatidylglycerol synthase domain-containing protein n=1 Tax=Oceanibaculum pacificum TaxID=580166 RepID=UPI000A7438DD|nr:lysylphosphatidylglycerol synthase domain-containing protein [Oceanibaculum pacificum]